MLPSLTELYRLVYTMRRFEETVLDNFGRGVFFGTTHTYIGQEANAAALLSQLEPGDIVFSNHRCHGHYIACGGDLRALFAELMGKPGGVCGGRGGSQHLHWRNFYSNGVQGGIVPTAVGMALAEQRLERPTLAVVFLGDGTLGEGVIYEAFNLAALWSAPVLFVVENNRIAQTTPLELALAGEIAARFAAFGIPVHELDTSDALEIAPVAALALAAVRQQRAPRALILNTCRFGPHSKGDDTRPPEQVAAQRQQRDPLAILAAHLDEATRLSLHAEIDPQVAAAFQAALAEPLPSAEAR